MVMFPQFSSKKKNTKICNVIELAIFSAIKARALLAATAPRTLMGMIRLRIEATITTYVMRIIGAKRTM